MRSTKYGSLERYFVQLARACRQRGHPTVIQYEARPSSPDYVDHLVAEGTRIAVVPTISHPLSGVIHVVRLLRSVRPEIVHTHFVTGYVLVAIAALARGLGVRRLIAMEHNPLDGKHTWHRRWAYARFDRVLGVSEDVCRSLLRVRVDPRIVSTHYLGLFGDREIRDQDRRRIRFELGVPEDAFVIACIGYDTPRKGFDILFQALRKVSETRPQAYVLIVGVAPETSRLPVLAETLGISQRVHWGGIRDEGWMLLQAADLYAQPSYSEGLPLGVMEAMSLRLPVVASRVGGLAEAVIDGESGRLVQAGSVESLAQAIQGIMADPARRSAMGHAAYQRYRRLFRGEDSARTLLSLYFPEKPA